MADPGIGTSVRYWLHYNNLASSFYKQYGSAKKVKDDYEKQIACFPYFCDGSAIS